LEGAGCLAVIETIVEFRWVGLCERYEVGGEGRDVVVRTFSVIRSTSARVLENNDGATPIDIPKSETGPQTRCKVRTRF
jgi:hypothetical protein